MTETAGTDDATREDVTLDVVFEAVVQIENEREGEEGLPDTETWVTVSEVAHRTQLDRATVNAALRSLGQDRLYIRSSSDVGDDVEVLGIRHSVEEQRRRPHGH